MDLITLQDVRAAAHLIAPHLPPTPVLAQPTLREGLWVKAENLTPVGAFKLRGALNAVEHLPPHARAAGVVTHSSGNHGAALAYAARSAGIPCVVVVPDSAIATKVEAVRRLGAEVHQVPIAQRGERANAVAVERGMTVIPPFDHAHVIAGQGTVGLELLQQRVDVEVVLVPVGGGGLASGVATAVKALRPEVTVLGVEPELAADAAQSVAEGRLVSWPLADTGRTIADGLRTGLSELTFAHLHTHLDGVLTVSEEQIRQATAALIRASRTVVEPSGAVAAAAALSGVAPAGRTVAVISGGNIEPRLLRELLPD